LRLGRDLGILLIPHLADARLRPAADIKNIPDADYKWQVLACDADGCAKNWQNYSGTTPNLRLILPLRAQPGNLTLSKKNDGSITLTFGSVSSDPHFKEYKIYYKQGLTGVKQTDTLLSSSSDAALGNINYLTHATTTISNLPAGTTYVLIFTLTMWSAMCFSHGGIFYQHQKFSGLSLFAESI